MSTQTTKKQNVVNQLKHFRNSINSIKSFLKPRNTEEVGCCECGSPACLWGKYDQFNDSAATAPSSAESRTIQDSDIELSNVVFTPGSYTESTEVYIDGIKVTGVSKASLDYDAEMGVPVLKLEIIAPQIQANIL